MGWVQEVVVQDTGAISWQTAAPASRYMEQDSPGQRRIPCCKKNLFLEGAFQDFWVVITV